MAIAFDAAVYGGSASSVLTFPHTCSGLDRFLIVDVQADYTDVGIAIAFNGVPLSVVGLLDNDDRTIYTGILESPPSGEHDVVITSPSSFIQGFATS